MISELLWDTDFFGRKIGRLVLPLPAGKELGAMLAEASEKGYRYLTCRLDADHIDDVQLLEGHGFYLTDTGITWKKAVTAPEASFPLARRGTLEDTAAVRKIAGGLFREGRFYHDPFFTPEEADNVYQEWTENLLRGLADIFFLMDEAGFVACKLSDGRGDIRLIGVDHAHRSKGIGTALMLNVMNWLKSENACEVTVRTQSGNIRAIGFYERLGFSIKATDITMGRMFPPASGKRDGRGR